jgi:DNA polymerase-3 subunit beta
MKFRASREALLRPLQVTGGVVERRQTLPILSNLLLQVSGDTLTMTGTDLEVELTATARVTEVEPGEITVPARKLIDICRSLPEGTELVFKVEDGKALIRSGRSRFSLATLPANDFPATDDVSGGIEFTLTHTQLKTLIERTQFCMANQDVRYYLNGMLLEIDCDVVRAVATDGHRLAYSEIRAEAGVSVKHQVIIPRKGVGELNRLLSEGEDRVDVRMNANHLRISLDGIVITSKLIDGRFPDYERVIPRQSTKQVVADRETLHQALARAAILSNEKYRGVRIEFSTGKLRALVSNPEQEEAEEELEVDYQGDPFEIGFNVSYVLEALSAVKEDKVSLSLTDANSSCLVQGLEDKASCYVIMPMRL